MHGKILTNHLRMIRSLADNDCCPICLNAGEDFKHLFLYCDLSANVWMNFSSIRGPQLEIQRNNSQSKKTPGGYFPSVLIVTTLWKLWLARNRMVFDNVSSTPTVIYASSLAFASEIVQSVLSFSFANPTQVRLVS